METYTKLGITVYVQGETVFGLPKFAQAEGDEMTVGNNAVIYSGDWYSMPLNNIDAVQLARDCSEYSNYTINESRLAEVLQQDDSVILYDEFYE